MFWSAFVHELRLNVNHSTSGAHPFTGWEVASDWRFFNLSESIDTHTPPVVFRRVETAAKRPRKKWNAASVEDPVEYRHHVTEIDRSVVVGPRRIETTRLWSTVEQAVKCGPGISNVDDAIRV